MTRPVAAIDGFVHEPGDLPPTVDLHSPHWRDSFFFELHRPDARGDVVFFTMARYPGRAALDSLQMGRVGGRPLLGHHGRAENGSTGDGPDGDPATTVVGGARIEVVRPFEEVRLWADPDSSAIGVDATFTARTQPYQLRWGTLTLADAVVWHQSHVLQSGVWSGTYTVDGVEHPVDGWTGQRDRSWGIRDHGRCPLWLWLQIQLDDGCLGVWHWERADGTAVYTDGCWAGVDGGEPVPVVGLDHELRWTGADGAPVAYGDDGAAVAGLAGPCTFTLADGRRIAVDASGSFERPYEPFHRGGLSQMRVTTGDGREGSAIYEITGSRHVRYFPDTVVTS